MSAFGGEADVAQVTAYVGSDPKRSSSRSVSLSEFMELFAFDGAIRL